MESYESTPKIVQEAEQIVTEAYEDLVRRNTEDVKDLLRHYLNKYRTDPKFRTQVDQNMATPRVRRLMGMEPA